MKRKVDATSENLNRKGILKKRKKKTVSTEDLQKCFPKDLFSDTSTQKYVQQYASSQPYRHAVITSLINDTLLRSVRAEVQENVHFTLKETDIYRIFQSGDLANLDGLDDGALEKLPSLLRLRDALYSRMFRNFISKITGCGELSAQKTDMAINVYTPGCHLLCHDDVIGSRRVSYILYLTDPDIPWKDEWGGALRLFPTISHHEDGVKTVTPTPDIEKKIPPAWNQLSFFAVQPGESFHDVEEVYHAATKEQLEKDGGRIRMAISGWYHIPQVGEEGYIEGEEAKWGKNSSLTQLQGNPDRYDFPKPHVVPFEPHTDESEELGLSERDLDFLLKYLAPTYLTPDTLGSVASQFTDLSSVTLDGLLSRKFSARVREYIEAEEKKKLPDGSSEIEKSPYKVARPPHKHRYLYLQPRQSSSDWSSLDAGNPIKELVEVLLPSCEFRRWLELATKCSIQDSDIKARRFRRGLDYSLATSYEDEPRLEITLGLTPTAGWGADEKDEPDENEQTSSEVKSKRKVKKAKKDHSYAKREVKDPADQVHVGGHEIYMVGDSNEVEDAAIYKDSADAEDETILFTVPASWNTMSIVFRDSGILNFVKYVSRSAQGDRWDVKGVFGVRDDGDDDDDNDDDDEQEESEEEVFEGFSDSEHSASE
ncbi:Prolyl 3,4-dihydroxylase [Podosphaera aphanis]|nr:Prolyl 3,4-dihydroxylase [Podosphaera aphanis]